eukprot:TRINITY_DN1162_c0_g1_i2.p1 TRINITY_DN1162_c0_g1~~TRINITY_DN1162_c0_g1_i2.p1  ORF type:complete len:244 (-),score=42.31 TRINITY_DN1162_c0_g1_i2:300-1031(-)
MDRRLILCSPTGSDEHSEQDVEPMVMLNVVLDILRDLLATRDVVFARECIERLFDESSSAYVAGLGRERWTWIRLHTTVDGRYLPRGTSLVYGGVPPSKRHENTEDYFLLGSLLDVLLQLLQHGGAQGGAGDLDLAQRLLVNLSAETVLAYVIGLDKAVLSKLKKRIALRHQRLPREAAGGRHEHENIPALDDHDEAEMGWCDFGLMTMPPRNKISVRVQPPADSLLGEEEQVWHIEETQLAG